MATALALAVALYAPGGRTPESNPRLPWQIDIRPDGKATIFNLTLGVSTLSDASREFRADAKVNLFHSTTQTDSLEAYFDRLYISGIKANIVLSLVVDKPTLKGIYDRGIRISKLGDGTKKITLAPKDMSIASEAVIEQITYLPTTDLDEQLVRSRFGKPSNIITEKSGIAHWLYPKNGLDIALNKEGKEVFQYINPGRFDEIMTPLKELESISTTRY